MNHSAHIASLTSSPRKPWDVANNMEGDAFLVRDYAQLIFEMLSDTNFSIETLEGPLTRLASEILGAGERLIEQNKEVYELARELRKQS